MFPALGKPGVKSRKLYHDCYCISKLLINLQLYNAIGLVFPSSGNVELVVAEQVAKTAASVVKLSGSGPGVEWTVATLFIFSLICI